MKIAIRENEIFLSFAERFDEDTVTSPPYNYQVAEAPDECLDKLSFSDFDLIGGEYLFNAIRHEARVREKAESERSEAYKAEIDRLIRLRYSINDELAILRQRDTKKDEYQEYYEYAEHAKDEAKNSVFGEN